MQHFTFGKATNAVCRRVHNLNKILGMITKHGKLHLHKLLIQRKPNPVF